ncbi:MAG TPA: type II toxin-antitoxin system VapC family toxin [Jiangellales bacterium]|nr:type II toxin-antitoxin system VapC family toxin [Jiangellales bacterium]
MKLVDANVLLYAVNRDAPHHKVSRSWLDQALAGATSVGLAWVPLLAFVRLATKVGLFPRPLSVDGAMNQVDQWLAQPAAHLVQPGDRHASILAALLRDVGTGGNLVNDAHVAALAIEHRAAVVSFDNDFDRFGGVTWERPV